LESIFPANRLTGAQNNESKPLTQTGLGSQSLQHPHRAYSTTASAHTGRLLLLLL